MISFAFDFGCRTFTEGQIRHPIAFLLYK